MPPVGAVIALPVSRTDAILAAVRRYVEEHRLAYDRADNIGEVTIKVKLQVGSTLVRSVELSEERIHRRT